MILKMDIEQIFPRSVDGWNRRRKLLTMLFAAYNDVISNARASSLLKYDMSSVDGRCYADSERRYFYRLGCAHLYEVLDVFEKCDRNGVISPFQPLSEEGEQALERLVSVARDSGQQDLRNYLAKVRNRTFHYSYAGTIEGDGYLLFAGQTRNDCRFVLAEDAMMAHIHEDLQLNGDSDAINCLLRNIVQLRNDLSRFVDHFTAALYQSCPEAFTEETSWSVRNDFGITPGSP